MQDRLSETGQRVVTYIQNGKGDEFEAARFFLKLGLVQVATQHLIDARKLPEDAYFSEKDASLLRDRALLNRN